MSGIAIIDTALPNAKTPIKGVFASERVIEREE